MNYILALFIFAFAPLAATASDTDPQRSQHVEIDIDTLVSWYEQDKPMIVLDARSEPYFDGTVLPNAKWLPCESDATDIEAAVPCKDGCIVVYCHGTDCPASGWLCDKLLAMGYSCIYEYHEGIEEWTENELPTDEWPYNP